MINFVRRAASGVGKHQRILVATAASVVDADCALQFTLRVANVADIPTIKACNEKLLPENYEYGVYHAHMTLWPSLAIVAEGKDEDRSFMGYVLGKLENDPKAMFNPFAQTTKRGHVTSVAVYPKYRRMGIAQDLMRALHSQLVKNYDVGSCTLHVRVTNSAALKLYTDILGYQVKARISNYYLDGEDAYNLTMEKLADQAEYRPQLMLHTTERT